ncbi:MAG: site-2 protease family protein [Erysipelotrichaceae bacterium]|nr:site-2 protease family protein [Erysipelotrichaceae bacterium]
MTIIYFLIILAVIIFVHELGHMLAAKLFGCYVNEFAIGFGPTVFKKVGKETTYSLRAIPLGGFTGMVEKENTPIKFDEEGNPTEFLNVPKERTFYGVKIWQRVIILLAGPLFNMFLACLVFVMIFQINGYVTEAPPAVIKEVVAQSAADEAGFKAGDVITKIVLKNGDTIIPKTFAEIVVGTQNSNDEMTYYVDRNGTELIIRVTPKYSETEQRYMIGIMATDPVVRKITFLQAIPEGISYAFEIIGLTFEAIIGLFTGTQGLDSLGGTISIYKYTEEAASYGFLSLLSLVGSLSVSVGIMNLVPIPIFDGGKILLAGVEKIIGHRPSERVEMALSLIGVGIVLVLFVFVTYQDIMKLL